MISVSETLMYRLLPPEEWHRLKLIFHAQKWFLPPEFLATASVAENEKGEIVAVQMLQMVLHSEPRWAHPDYRGKVNFVALDKVLEELPKERKNELILPGYVLIADTPEVARLAERAGFKKVEGTVYKREW